MIRIWLTGVFLLILYYANGQRVSLFSGNFENVTAEEFFRSIEKATPYYFYYDEKEMDSIRISGSFKDQSVPDVLKYAFRDTDLQFSIDEGQNRIFVRRRIQIITSLPDGFFDEGHASTKSDYTASLIINSDSRNVKRLSSEIKTYEIGVKTNQIKQGNAIITGYVRNERSGEPVINASLFINDLNIGVLSDQQGFYRLTVPAGSYSINVQGIGMKDAKYQVVVYSDGGMDIHLKEQVRVLKEVVVSAQKLANLNRVQLGVERLNIEAVKRVPTVFGEADVMRVVMTLPGVKTVGEASTGFNVRGGSADQNLILLNGGTIYNPSHFFGMFSAFNPEIVKDIELYKSSIPAKFGGRLSSVLDVSLREGNKKTISGSAGIGVVTSRLNIEGPLIKDKTSFIAGVRSTYANWLLKILPHPYHRSKASFYDANLSISHKLDNRNDIFFTGYLSQDKFNLASDTTYGYNNRNAGLKWKHNFNNKLIGLFSGHFDRYQYDVHSDKNEVNAYTLKFGISQFNLKSDLSYLLNTNHTIDFGAGIIRYSLTPGSFLPRGSKSIVSPNIVSPEQAIESSVYISEGYNVTQALNLNAGLRYTVFNFLGPGEISYYAKGVPKDVSTVTNTRSFSSGRIINTYHGPEIRFSARYSVSDDFSVKAGYNSLRQYIHMLSNTAAVAPTDIWKLSDPNIKPQQGQQVSVGFYKNFKANTIETSLEVYYKKIKDYLDYKPGATLVLNHHVETDVINTKGKAYGAEIMIKKRAGKLNGWVSYTYSRILLKMDDPATSALVNGGEWYPANYDKPHDVTAVGNFKVNHRFSLSLNLTYSTGRPVTLPVGRFYYGGSQRVQYSDRNSYRIPEYFRTDFSMNIDGNHKVNQRTHNSWTIGVYNITGRKNPFSVYYVSENGRVNGYKLSIFGSAIPFINFNIRF